MAVGLLWVCFIQVHRPVFFQGVEGGDQCQQCLCQQSDQDSAIRSKQSVDSPNRGTLLMVMDGHQTQSVTNDFQWESLV